MVPRSWVTSIEAGQVIRFDPLIPVGGIAMGGDRGVAKVDVSTDGGRSWRIATLGPDHGRFSFRRWDALVPLPGRGRLPLMTRCWNTAGQAQSLRPNWNPGGYMRGCVETMTVIVA